MAARTRVLLDTSAYSHLRRGNAAVIESLATARVIIVSATVLGELHAAFACGSRAEENERALEEFLGEPLVETRPVTVETSRRYGLIFAALRAAGTPLPTNDIWIAAQALDDDAHVLTFDRDFERVPGLSVTVFAP